ncbi:MAG: hypothetical protein A3F70_19240 [Acidobacteria bacterium RIFCSPLOWO2_12_FULL_67_14]|nr:MAG: hypothetical protein A3F70_19240 [Acidobacteria bacterium RIFCSPLOWO2_12_FULL_67_14]
MRSPVHFALLALMALTLAGCRQADGPVPTPDESVLEDLGDVRKDLEYIATGYDPSASKDLAADLGKYVDEMPPAAAAVDELSRRGASVVAQKKLPEQTGDQLALNLWLAIQARQISERQVEALQNDTQALLMTVGIAEENAQQVAAQIGEVQRLVTARQRRWYELF